jgi:hypothetical protein
VNAPWTITMFFTPGGVGASGAAANVAPETASAAAAKVKVERMRIVFLNAGHAGLEVEIV